MLPLGTIKCPIMGLIRKEGHKVNGPLFRNVVILRTPSKVASVFCFMYYIYSTFLQLAQIYLNRTNICHILHIALIWLSLTP